MSDKLLEGLTAQQKSYTQAYAGLLSELVLQGQKPDVLLVACCDSRIMPERLFGLGPGQFFMLRNIANAIPPYWQTDIGIASILEYAVIELEIPHIAVLGHTDCGGIRALDEKLDTGTHPALARWLDHVRPALQEVEYASENVGLEERHKLIVERNVVFQLNNLRSYPYIRDMELTDKLLLHGWVLDLTNLVTSYYEAAEDKFIQLS